MNDKEVTTTKSHKSGHSGSERAQTWDVPVTKHEPLKKSMPPTKIPREGTRVNFFNQNTLKTATTQGDESQKEKNIQRQISLAEDDNVSMHISKNQRQRSSKQPRSEKDKASLADEESEIIRDAIGTSASADNQNNVEKQPDQDEGQWENNFYANVYGSIIDGETIKEQQGKGAQGGGQENMYRGSQSMYDDNCFKKQMELRGGKLHQLITDQEVNDNRIFANRYVGRGIIGFWYFTIDCLNYFENFLIICLIGLIEYHKTVSTTSASANSIQAYYAISALLINVVLMSIRNIIFEKRQLKVTNKINNKLVQYLYISQKRAIFLPITWDKVKPGHILKVLKGQEFPADCLILDIIGRTGQKCYVTCGPFDDNMSIVQKKSFSFTSNKTGNRQSEQIIADMINGQIKYEYNYYGYITGSFKLSENPDASDFDFENVVMRGTYLRETPEVICLVLNVGQQCLGSIYKDPKKYSESFIDTKLQSYVKTQKSFDKAYKQQIRIFLILLFVSQIVVSWLIIYLGSNINFSSVLPFEEMIIQSNTSGYIYYFDKFVGCLLIMLSSIPFSFSNIIHLLILFSTNFAEWDIDVIPAAIFFRQPHATLAFGKVAHIFFSRSAIQSEAHQAVKLIYCGGRFFKNQYSQKMWQDFKNNQMSEMDMSFSSGDHSSDDGGRSDWEEGERNNSQINYFPNELINLAEKFQNFDLDSIINMPKNEQNSSVMYNHINQLFRALTLCHQCQLISDDFNTKETSDQYIGIFNDEITTVDFARQHGYKLISRRKKQIVIDNQGKVEQYDELGLVETRALQGHFMTICAVRIKGQSNGILYMKGSIATLKHYLTSKDSDLEYLNIFQQRFIQTGLKSVVYAKRILSLEETNQLIITLNEGVSQTKQNKKLESLLQNLTKKQLEILGILGIQKGIHLRNRVVIDDMILNGVKPWIISQDVEQSHLTSLNSMRVFQGCASPLLINGTNQKVVQDQIQNCLRVVIERLEINQQQDIKKKEDSLAQMKKYIASKSTIRMKSWISQFLDRISGIKDQDCEQVIKNQKTLEKEYIKQKDKEEQSKQTEKGHQNLRNCVVFTGRAMNEIFRDLTMQKSFMTLAYLSDMLVGSEIKPLMKQNIISMVKNFIGEGEYTVSILTTPEDQFMVNDSDLSVNLKDKGKSTDFQAMVDVTLKDFSAVSYLLFKHGNQIQQRLSKAVQAFIYKTFLLLAILVSHMVNSAFSTSIPFLDTFYFFFMLFLSPLQILVFATFYKDYGNEYYYRIFGHYKYNFSFTMVEPECIIGDILCLFIDCAVIFFPMVFMHGTHEMTIDGKNTAHEVYMINQMILTECVYFLYFCNTNQTVIYAIFLQLCFILLGVILVFDGEGLHGVQMLIMCPSQVLCMFLQVMVLWIRNILSDVSQKVFIARYASLYEWYSEIEEKLAYEEFENINQIFSINQNQYLYHKINSSNIERTLKLINQNMIKCTKNQELEQILEKINSELDYSRRGQLSLSGTINRLTLRFNDLNKESEYQINKNAREITYVRKQLFIFCITTLLFAFLGILFYVFIKDFTNVGIIYYLALSFISFMTLLILPYIKIYISRLLFAYTIIIIGCYTVYTSESQSLQPCGLIFVLAYVAGLNHSYVYPTMIMILASVLMFVFFSLVSSEFEQLKSTISGYRSLMWIITGLCWSIYVYLQELEKKIQFVRGYSKVRNFIKLKTLLSILVPSLVRDKISSGKKNTAEDEGEGTIIQVEINNFDEISKQYSPKELVQLIDQVYNQFDILCDHYGIQKIESIGKKYMACAGLKSVDKKIDNNQLNKHHSVRIIDFAMEIQNYVKNVYLKSGNSIQIKTGIHTGNVVSVLVGDIKPQFSLIGKVINKTNQICSLSHANKVTIGIQTMHYLELYTNNLSFIRQQISAKAKKLIGTDYIFIVQKSKGKVFGTTQQTEINNNNNMNEAVQQIFNQQIRTGGVKGNINPQLENLENNSGNREQEMSMEKSDENNDSNEYDLIGNYNANENSFQKFNQQNDFIDNDSQQSDDKSDEGKMNVFEFNDDMGQLDDRVIIQNPTENAKYNLVERPKYLLQFENKESETEFLFKISKQESKKTSAIMLVLCVLNKLIIIGDQVETMQFNATGQFIAMFPILVLELILIYKLNNPKKEQIQYWTMITIFYGVIVMTVLLSLEFQYIGKWSRAGFNELLLELTLSLFFFMRNIQLRYYVYMYMMFLGVMLIFLIIYRNTVFQYQCIQFFLGQVMYFVLLCCGLHHREMIQRKSLNYERVLNYETKKTNELISNLIPSHLLNDIINEKKSVDQFENMTILQVEIMNFVDYNKDIIKLLSRLFSRFDQLTQENKVYKVCTIGDLYIVMGYSGRVDQSNRTEDVILDEAHRVIQTAFQMIDSLEEVKKQMLLVHKLDFSGLQLRIGIHTGQIIAGFIGQKVVKYDIFGETVLIAHKMKNNQREAGQVCISYQTKCILEKSHRTKKLYNFLFIGEFRIKSIERVVIIYSVRRNQLSDMSISYEDIKDYHNSNASHSNQSDAEDAGLTSRSHGSARNMLENHQQSDDDDEEL